MKAKQITTAIITILLLIAVGYIIFDKAGEYLKGERLLYYNNGTDDGINYWNQQVVNIVNKECKLPFILNNTIQTIAIEQLCKEDKDESKRT